MNYNIISTDRFEKELKRLSKKYPSLKYEFEIFISELSTNPKMGTLLGNHCYKIRLLVESKGKGKRGGARVITYLYQITETIYLLSIYDKSEKSDLKPNELKYILENLDFDT